MNGPREDKNFSWKPSPVAETAQFAEGGQLIVGASAREARDYDLGKSGRRQTGAALVAVRHLCASTADGGRLLAVGPWTKTQPSPPVRSWILLNRQEIRAITIPG